MTKKEIVQKFINKPSYLKLGAPSLAKKFGVSTSVLRTAKEEARWLASVDSNPILQQLPKQEESPYLQQKKEDFEDYVDEHVKRSGQNIQVDPFIKIDDIKDPVKRKEFIQKKVKEVLTEEAHITNRNTDKDGKEIVKIVSNKPLNREELEQLVEVDNLNSFIERVWCKSNKGGTQWDYSILLKYLVQNFYTKDELESRLSDIFPAIKSSNKVYPKKTSEQAMFVYLADIHAGATDWKGSVYGNEYSGTILAKRLLKLQDYIIELSQGRTFDKVFTVTLGDELQGWSQQTTRAGHIVSASSNKEQFDIYTTVMSLFHTELIESISHKNYTVYSVENSNHSGLAFAYMANKAVELYLKGKYKNLSYVHQDKFIDSIEYGRHIIALEHGKDESAMKHPHPFKLDAKTDGWLADWFAHKGYTPYTHNLHLYKGDLHTYGAEKGKFGRYINVPSLYGSSLYSELNYSNSVPGAVVEIMRPNSDVIEHHYIPLI